VWCNRISTSGMENRLMEGGGNTCISYCQQLHDCRPILIKSGRVARERDISARGGISHHGSIIEKEEARPERLILISPKSRDCHCFAIQCTVYLSHNALYNHRF
jgi:hypothetical protein